MPHGERRRALLLETAVALAVAALISAVYLSFAQYGFDVLEEGYFLANARRLLDGDVPYRDFNTPYTPGIFYVYAWMMAHFGPNVVVLRMLHVAGRFVFMLALYALGRTVASPFYAALAPAVVLGLDTVPGIWSLHPAWLATPCSIVGVLCVALYLRTANYAWLLATGLVLGVAFAFKQNLAAYGLMAALWILVVFERKLPPIAPRRRIGPWPLRLLARVVRAGAQSAALVLFPLVPAMIALPYMSPLIVAAFLGPLAAMSLVGLGSVVRGAGRGALTYGRELAFYVRPLVVLVGFGVVTAAWFVPFFQLIGGRVDLLDPIIGRIEQPGYYLSMLPPEPTHLRVVALSLAPAVIVPILSVLGLWGRRGAALGLGLAAAVVVSTARRSWAADDPWNALDWLLELRGIAQRFGAVVGEGAYSNGEIVLYLPSVAFWVGLAAVVVLRRRGLRQDPSTALRTGPSTALRTGPSTSSDVPSTSSGRRLVPLWLLASGAALLFNQYPRMDSIHLLWSGGVLLLVGAALFERWEGLAMRLSPALASGGGRVAMRLALLTLPVVAVAPSFFARVEYGGLFFRPKARPEELTRREGPYGLLRLDVEGDRSGVWLPGKDALVYEEIVAMLHEKTAPDEPIFAYPAIPGFYYLAERHNPTPFNHLFPSMASDADQAEIVRRLERVNYIVWDDAGAHLWVWPGLYAPVTEYIRLNFRIERFVGQYAILSRQAVIDWGEPLYYWLPGQEPWNLPGWQG